MKTFIHTNDAPAAIGTYSQAVKVNHTFYCSGQIPLVPETMALDNADFGCQVRRVFTNLTAVVAKAGGQLSDIVKLTIYLTDLGQFDVVNEIMAQTFAEPYPARAVIQVSALPKGVNIEVDAIGVLP